jgi:hypothetical protein
LTDLNKTYRLEGPKNELFCSKAFPPEQKSCRKARSVEGANRCTWNVPTANRSAPTRILQNTKRADQSAKKRATPYRTHVLPLLTSRGWKRPILKKITYTQYALRNVVERIVN